MRKLPRRVLQAALGLVAIVVVAVGVALIVLHTDWGREQVRERVEAQLAQTFVGGATVGKLEGSPFGELRARDLVINGPDGEPAITAKTVRIRLALVPLMSQQARISSLVLEDVEVILDRDEGGELELSRLLRPGPKSGWSVELPDVRIHRAHVSYDTGRGERWNLDGAELRAEVYAPFERPLRAEVRLTGQWRERGVPIELDAGVRTGEEVLIERAFARAGGVSLNAEDVRIGETPDGNPAFSGAITIDAPRAAVARLGLGFETPVDLSVRAKAAREPGSPWTRVELDGLAGGEPVTARLRVDLDARRLAGTASAGTLDVTALSGGRIQGAAGGSATFDLAMPEDRELPVGTATIDARGTLEGVPQTAARIALVSTGDRVSATAAVTGRELRANVSAEISKHGEELTLHRGELTARTGDPARATGGAAPVHGALRAELTASGALAPRPSLAVAGTIDGRRLRVRDLSVESMKLSIDARQLPARPLGRAELVAHGVVRGTMHLVELAVTARNREDGKLAVAVRTRPKQHPWLVEADAVVTPGDVVAIDLVRHHVRAGSGADWRGTSGRIAIGPERIEVRDLATRGPNGGALEIDGVLHRAGRRAGDLEARIDAKAFALGNLDPDLRGTASGHVELRRTGGRLTGRADVTGRGLALDRAAVPLDAEAKLEVREGRLALDARVSGPRLGRVALAADVDAPRDASDPRAWQALRRGAIRTGRLALERVDVGRLAELAGQPGEHQGVIDGELQLSGTGASGAVAVRGLVTPATRGLGRIDGELQLSQTSRGQLAPALAVRVAGLGSVSARAEIAPPARPFDPDAWRRLGLGAIASAKLHTSEVAFDPGTLDRLGIATDLRGRVSLSLELEDGTRVARLAGHVRELRGGPIAQPVAVELRAVAGGEATTFRLAAAGAAARLLEVHGRIPRSLAQLQASPRTAPLQVTATLPAVPARQLLDVLGRNGVVGGTVSGTIEVAGTIGGPTGRARITAAGVAMPPGPLDRPTKSLDRLVLDASWDGRTGTVTLAGAQPGGTLDVIAKGSPEALDRATLQLRAKQFDLRPLLVFLPGAAGAGEGILDANLTVTSLDPRTARAAGELHVAEARFPIAPAIGTLRRAKLDVVADERAIRLALDGRLGGGTVEASGTIALAGAAPTGGEVKLALREVSPIGALEPEIDADVTAKLTRGGDRWIADVTIRNGSVKVPSGRGDELKPVGAPEDMVFAAGDPGGRRVARKRPPRRPMIEARIQIEPTYFEAEEVRGYLRGRLKATADADSVGLVGVIEAVRADLDLFGRRYLVERAVARFDGPPDPLLEIVITHDFPEVTTITTVRGRLSKPELIMSADPSMYSQGQLLGFLLGGEPNGEPATGNPRDRVTAAGTSLVANQLSGYVQRALPFDVDVLRYEAATASSSAAFTVGTWLTRSLFVAYRRRFEPQADENTGEAQVEYWLTRRVMFDGVLGDRGYSGLDLLWRKRY